MKKLTFKPHIMTPKRLSLQAITKIAKAEDPQKLLYAYTKCVLTYKERQAIIKRADEIGVDLPKTDLIYVP